MKTTGSFKNILVPIDFQSGSDRALDHALAFAPRFEANVTLVHAYSLQPPAYAPGVAWPSVDFADAAQRALDASVRAAKERYPRVEGILVRGEPWEVILATAKDRAADLIVMGTHGRRGIPRLLIGSVAEKVVRLAPIPVLTVPPEREVATTAPTASTTHA
jgi:nucleotide-binding universal stress UspA family protein